MATPSLSHTISQSGEHSTWRKNKTWLALKTCKDVATSKKQKSFGRLTWHSIEKLDTSAMAPVYGGNLNMNVGGAENKVQLIKSLISHVLEIAFGL